MKRRRKEKEREGGVRKECSRWGMPSPDHGTVPKLRLVYPTAARPVPCNVLCDVVGML